MYFWKINDGQVYSFDAAAFVEPGAEDLVQTLYEDTEGKISGLPYLRETVLFYIKVLGDGVLGDALKNRLDKIQDIQAEYAPQLTALQEAYASAQMLDNGEAQEIQQEYKQLLQEMQEKIQAVPHD